MAARVSNTLTKNMSKTHESLVIPGAREKKEVSLRLLISYFKFPLSMNYLFPPRMLYPVLVFFLLLIQVFLKWLGLPVAKNKQEPGREGASSQ